MAELGHQGTAAGGSRYLVRATDTDRERAVTALRAAFVQGALSKDEFEDRIERALAARTRTEVSALAAGLPGELCAPGTMRQEGRQRDGRLFGRPTSMLAAIMSCSSRPRSW